MDKDEIQNFMTQEENVFLNKRNTRENATQETKNFIQSIDAAFEGDVFNNFKEFINLYPNVEEWCVSSDYCLDDRRKKNSTIAFSVFPYSDINYLKKAINSYIPKDIKDTKLIPSKTLRYLKDFPYFFNFVFYIENDYKIDYKALFKQIIDILRDKNINEQTIKKYSQRYQKYQSSSFSKKLFANIHIISILASYIMSLLLRMNPKVKKNIWFPDRGNEFSAFFEILADMYMLALDGLKEVYKLPIQEISGIAKENPDTHTFDFDELIRIPDYYAGTLASFNYKKLEVDDKYLELLLKTVVDNNRFALATINISEKINITGIRLSKKNT